VRKLKAKYLREPNIKNMKSLERRFKNISEKKPLWSSFICFAEAVKRKKFNKQTIHRWFYKLVEKDDYARNEKKGILKHLYDLSNVSEDDTK
jgi:hypothetical protein